MQAQQGRMNRRSVIGMGAAAILLCVTGPVQAQAVVIRAIKVTGRANRDLARIAPMVAHELGRQLGARYAPGARGGATLVVNLTDVSLPIDTGGSDRFFRHSGGGNSDSLEGEIALIGPRGAAIQQFPLLASRPSTDASDRYFEPSEARLSILAYTYSYWLISKLG